jgi:HD superfamily phosphohydrolase
MASTGADSDDDAVRIADPVHGYINITPIERALLDTPAAQRLRYVGQSGLAHLVFPDLRTSRFIHSLGAMHLASRFLTASIEKAEPSDRDAALQAIKAAVEEEIGEISDAKLCAEQLENYGLLGDRAAPPQYAPYLILAEQGLRLAALFHDLGHLPFSHDFEFALEQLATEPAENVDPQALRLLKQRPGRDALHERIGHDLTYLLLQTAFARSPREAERVTFGIARHILATSAAQTIEKIRGTGGLETAAEGAWAWLHTLIAGELDVDRCDYVLRDARNYGFDSARFDLQRLIDNFIVVQDPEVQNALVPAIRPRGQAAVEAFLIARARVYQWGTRHHKVGQVAAALQYAIGELLRPALGDQPSQDPLRSFLADIETILDPKETRKLDKQQREGLLMRFAGYDDQWWMNMLRATHQDDEWFALVCWRSRGPRCLWKRVVDFPLAEPLTLREWNTRLPTRTDVEGRRRWDDAVRSLRKDGVLVVRHRFEPWKPSEATKDHEQPQSALSFYVPDNEPGRRLVPVSNVSYPVAALREGWLRDLQVHAYADSKSAVSGPDVLKRLMPSSEEA